MHDKSIGMIWETLSAMRDLPRLQEIASVLVRYGLGDLMKRLGIINVLKRAGRILRWKESEAHKQLETPERVRLALEALGPTFVKLGQVLATRVDIFPPDWIAEFEKLQSKVPAVAFEELRPELEKALGGDPEQIFRHLNPVAVAAASIAQVHTAELADGTPVVLKVRRPGVVPKIEADLRILAHIARLLELEIPEVRRYRPTQVVAQFKRSLRRELDFAMEARNIERFSQNFAQDPTVLIPRVYWEWTRETVNVQQAIQGIAGTDLAAVDRAGLDRRLLAARGADAVLKMILVDGYSHADPHPGNVFYLPGERLGMVDFGMVGRLSNPRRNEIVDLLTGLVRKDERAMIDVLLNWTDDRGIDEGKLAADVGEFVFNYENLPLKDINFGLLLREITVIIRENSLVLPPDLTLLFKTLITLEGLGRQLDPAFQMLDHLTPFIERVVKERYAPAALVARGRHSLTDLLGAVIDIPRDFARLVKDARRGGMRIDLDLKRLDHFGHQLDKSTSRLTLGILTASLVVGSSIVMTVKGGPSLLGLPLFGLLGFLVAFLNSMWLILSIWRSGKD